MSHVLYVVFFTFIGRTTFWFEILHFWWNFSAFTIGGALHSSPAFFSSFLMLFFNTLFLESIFKWVDIHLMTVNNYLFSKPPTFKQKAIFFQMISPSIKKDFILFVFQYHFGNLVKFIWSWNQYTMGSHFLKTCKCLYKFANDIEYIWNVISTYNVNPLYKKYPPFFFFFLIIMKLFHFLGMAVI